MAHACLSVLLALQLASSPPSDEQPTGTAPADTAELAVLEAAVADWREGNWTEVRKALAPRLVDGGTLGGPEDTRRALTYFADATLQDTSLPEDERDALAREAVGRLLDENGEWAPPPANHLPPLYALTKQMKAEREQAEADACQVERAACNREYVRLGVDLRAVEKKLAALQEDYDKQEVIEVQKSQSGRGLALIPFGVGHFVAGRNGMGAGFLSGEVAFGAAGLSLLFVRTFRYDCNRTSGFARGSLQCSVPSGLTEQQARQRVVALRNAEQTMGFLFLGSVVADIIVGQVLYKPSETRTTRKIKREDLGDEGASPAKTERRGAKLRPTTSVTPTSAALGLRLDF